MFSHSSVVNITGDTSFERNSAVNTGGVKCFGGFLWRIGEILKGGLQYLNILLPP